SVVVDDKFFARADDPESRAEREPRPIGRGADHVAARQISAERISSSAFFNTRVSGCSHIGHASEMRISGFDCGQRFLHYGLVGAAGQNTTKCNNYCKVKAFWHLQHRGLK